MTTLIHEVRSGRGHLYGKAGDEVTVISVSEPAVIVRNNRTQETFPTVTSNLKDGDDKRTNQQQV